MEKDLKMLHNKNARTILVRAYTGGNCGDDLFLKILFERFSKSKILLLIFPKQYKLYKEWLRVYQNLSLIHMPTFPFIRKCFLKFISLFDAGRTEYNCKSKIYFNFFIDVKNKIDVYIYIGGSMFAQFRSGLTIKDKLETVIVSALFDKPKYILGANFGPFVSDDFREYYKTVFGQYDDICFRDYKSYNYFRDLTQVRRENDIVFSLNYEIIEKEKLSVGVSIIDLLACKPARNTRRDFEEVYSKTIIELIERFLSENRPVYLFAFCCGDGDEKAIQKILKKLTSQNKSMIRIIEYKGDLDLFISEYMKVETMIVTRFHAMILSLLAGQYMYPLIYDQKMYNVLQDLHYNDQYSEISNIAPVDEILFALRSRNFILPYSSVRGSAERQFLKLDAFINENE
jgi:colanic acid/amylovoran biosynthesis protein